MAGANYYQVGPILTNIGPHLYPLQFGNVPQPGIGYAFMPRVDYFDNWIPDDVPGGPGYPDPGNPWSSEQLRDRNRDGVLRPGGFVKGAKYELRQNKRAPWDYTADEGPTHPFVIGWGIRIAEAWWIEVDYPYAFPSANEQVASVLRPLRFVERHARRGYKFGSIGPNGEQNYDRFFIWVIALEFDLLINEPVAKGATPKPRPRAPVRSLGMYDADDSYGKTISYSKGARRLVGAKIWALGLESGVASLQESAVGSWADLLGRPLEVGEEIFANRIWMNGRLVWNAEDGTLLEELGDLNFAFYDGAPDQMPDPQILADKGEDRTPAWRDFIYIRFTDVKLEMFGNQMPEVEVEILRVDGQRIPVAGTLENVAQLGGALTVTTTGITQMADGVVFYTMNPRGLLEQYKDQYNYRIIDNDPLWLRHNEVNAELTIDRELASTDFIITEASDPVVANQRADDTAVPNQLTISYVDKSQDYQTRPQYARLPIYPVPVTSSRSNEDLSTDFIITAVEALDIAWGVLMRRRAQRHKQYFRLMPQCADVEEGDVIRVPTGQGTFVMEVAASNLAPDMTQDIEADFLLPEDGAVLTADAGDILSNSVRRPLYYPQVLYVSNTSWFVDQGKIIAVVFDGDTPLTLSPGEIFQSRSYTSFVSTDVPSRISLRVCSPLVGAPFIEKFAINNDYVFHTFWNYVPFGVSDYRIRLLAIDRYDYTQRNIVTGINPGQVTPVYGVWRYSPGEMAANEEFLFIALHGAKRVTAAEISETYPFDTDVYRLELAIVDLGHLDDLETQGITQVVLSDVQEPLTSFISTGAQQVLVYNNWVFISFIRLTGHPNYIETGLFRYNFIDGTLDELIFDHPIHSGVEINGQLLFLPRMNTQGIGDTDFADYLSNTMGARVDCTTLEVTYFDAFADENTTMMFTQIPWTDGESMFYIVDNMIRDITDGGTVTVPEYVNQPYLARIDPVTLEPLAGVDLSQYYNNTLFQLLTGAFEGRYHYLRGSAARTTVPHGPGCILKVEINFAYAIFFPASDNPPENDEFPGTRIELDTIKKWNNIFASKEDGEPDHGGNPGGASVWWTFSPTVSARYEVEAIAYDAYKNPTGFSWGTNSGNFVCSVYVGSTVDNLVQVATTAGQFLIGHGYVEFNANAGTKYRIVIDGIFGGGFAGNDPEMPDATTFTGAGQIQVYSLDEFYAPNDMFEDSLLIQLGQTATDYDNRYATVEAGEPDHAGNITTKSLWWHFTATEDADIQIETVGDGPMALAVYTGDEVDNLVEVVSVADDGAGSDEDYASWYAGAY